MKNKQQELDDYLATLTFEERTAWKNHLKTIKKEEQKYWDRDDFGIWD